VVFKKDGPGRKDKEGWRLTERNKTRTIIVDLLSVAWATSRVVNAIFPAGRKFETSGGKIRQARLKYAVTGVRQS
jgi:hypothetical protein